MDQRQDKTTLKAQGEVKIDQEKVLIAAINAPIKKTWECFTIQIIPATFPGLVIIAIISMGIYFNNWLEYIFIAFNSALTIFR